VFKSTPAMTSLDANVCRRSWLQVGPFYHLRPTFLHVVQGGVIIVRLRLARRTPFRRTGEHPASAQTDRVRCP
jgi:hypothetical protein